MEVILVLVSIYIILSFVKIISDFRQPLLNQPEYIRCPNIKNMLGALLLSPIFWIIDNMLFPRSLHSKRYMDDLKKQKELEKEHKRTMNEFTKLFR